MSSLITLFLAIIAVIGSINIAATAPAEALDINKILELVQQQRLNSGTSKQRRVQLRQDSADNSDNSFIEDGGGADNHRYESLSKQRIINLIEKVANEKNGRHNKNVRISYLNDKSDIPKLFGSNSDKRDDSDNLQKQIIDKLFSEGLIDEERKAKQRVGYQKKRRISPSRTFSLNSLNNNNKNAAKGLENYSKVYVVLNPEAVQRSKNKNALNDLISKVLSLSGSAPKISRQVNKPRRYKGFLVKEDHALRRSRQFRENYRRDSMGDDYNRKRLRNGGNPGAGHTSIPYIRHRGDIYEREDK